MEQVTPQQGPLNVIFFPVLRGHCSIYSMGTGDFLLQIQYLVPTQFKESILPPLTRPKI